MSKVLNNAGRNSNSFLSISDNVLNEFRKHKVLAPALDFLNANNFKSQISKLKKYKFYIFYDHYFETNCINLKFNIFGEMDEVEKEKLKKDPFHYWIFDASTEGDSSISVNWFKHITDSAIYHDIPFNKIIFVSGNILEKLAYDQWIKKNNIKEKFYILSIAYWLLLYSNKSKSAYNFSIDDTVNNIRKNNKRYFLSLNRRLRPFRMITSFLLKNSKVFNKGLISADSLKENNIKDAISFWRKYSDDEIDDTFFNDYLNTLPWILDRKFNVIEDFEGPNNIILTNPSHLYEQSIFSIVSETHHQDWLNTSLFYSEKTVKPMTYNHPVLIFGQPNMNTYLTHIGFNTYDKYFDLNFDNIKNPLTRLKTQISQLEKICDLLDSYNVEQKIEWVLQDKDTLLHNKEQLNLQTFNISQLEKFIEYLNSGI
jgi:hypothetical protein